jgi:hypothetical protein
VGQLTELLWTQIFELERFSTPPVSVYSLFALSFCLGIYFFVIVDRKTLCNALSPAWVAICRHSAFLQLQ